MKFLKFTNPSKIYLSKLASLLRISGLVAINFGEIL